MSARGILGFGFLAVLVTAYSGYGQSTGYERIDGATSPHLIANYYGWARLFWRADQTYRLGLGHYHTMCSTRWDSVKYFQNNTCCNRSSSEYFSMRRLSQRGKTTGKVDWQKPETIH
jgi:hypothetical protein